MSEPTQPPGEGVAPAIEIARPTTQSAPLIVSSPHSGRAYDAAFLAGSGLDPLMLRRSEDSFVDELFGEAPICGAVLLKAVFPRAYLDVNREPYELDPAMFSEPLPAFVNKDSPRVKSGFGTIAQVVAGGGAIYRGKLTFAEAEARIARLYRPYHAALAELIDATVRRFGCAILLDCHSMPSIGGLLERDGSGRRVDIVLGDRYGRSCDPVVIATAETQLARAGYGVRRNDPYAGGFTTEHYGQPQLGVHVLQVELNRALYMDEARFVPGPGFARVRGEMRQLMETLSGLAVPALAAE